VKVIVRAVVVAGAVALATSTVGGQPVPDKSLEALLKDSRIWGRDFAEVLAAMPAFSEAGEKQIVVYQRRVETSREFRNRAEAMKVDTQARAASRKTGWTPLPSFRDLLGPVMSRSIVTAKAAPVDTPDREGVHLAWIEPKQLLAPNLTRASLTEAHGQPQRVTRRIIPTDDERRPVVLTELHYAGGAIVFAQPDYAPRPGVIDRVVLDTARTTETVFAK
jgi:hypothetical protein